MNVYNLENRELPDHTKSASPTTVLPPNLPAPNATDATSRAPGPSTTARAHNASPETLEE